MGFSRQEYWSGWPFPSPGLFPDQGIEPGSPASQADFLPSGPPGNDLMSKDVPLLLVHLFQTLLMKSFFFLGDK